MKQEKTAIVIGAGVASLAAAIRLAVEGYEVDVFEKNEVPGGKLGLLIRGGYRFDTGPSLFTEPANIAALFSLAGESMEDHLPYEPVTVSCTYFYEDGGVLQAHRDPVLFAATLAEQHQENPAVVETYLRQAGNMYDRIGKLFTEHSLHQRNSFSMRSVIRALKTTRPAHLFGTLHQLNRKTFRNEKTVQLFNRYATYNGSDPYSAPGMLKLISHLEHNEGIYYPAGGMISIVNALYQLALRKQVRFHFNTPVQRIITHEGYVTGVVAGHRNHYTGNVISNMDVFFTYKHLLGHDYKAARLLRRQRSSSAAIFYWGIRHEFPQFGLHNVLFSGNYKAEFNCIFKQARVYEDPTIYINITSKQEAGIHAPHGCENWFVMINVPSVTGGDREAFRKHCRQLVITKLNRMLQTDIEPLIETEDFLDPDGIQDNTMSYKGALYGSSSNSAMSAFLRHPNFSKELAGLYFTGGSVHPGGGIPLCLKSAAIVSGLITKAEHKKH
ncbi:1-hydroxycarotenoid 3,4-desaturase CrtD [Sediminibacterium ginsengisoli]|uniref:Phytoene desaturase n=1 Tax=Sediminibacterium ginsengisoli TaxID=413434 RepID=A0A1T4JV50_9BACT|nr:1-hydroxycarotenoid 3,4-desaturase CrtD [Sediminibacterium ginsengisoli]SJZ33947.1 phytoene desaturase [Sediminibacterium ginsengisoli]